ncbi:hypothetical protein BSKO_12052 [Bryopsis sp. KO-2023]|nr:hypothetical protein BSKO_12052 [Bryopsis sp. KO-2023]
MLQGNSPETGLLPALDVPGGGVHWGSVAKLVKVVKDANGISKHLRYIFKARLNTGDCHRVLNTLTVLHTLSLNCSEELRKQLADSRYMKMLERTFTLFDHPAMKAAVVQLLMDWHYLFSDEDLGPRSVRYLKSLKAKGAQPVRPSIVATERREDVAMGLPNHRFTRGVDFGLEAKLDRSPGDMNGLSLVSPRTTRGNKIGRFANKIFRRSPSLPSGTSPTPPSSTPTSEHSPPPTNRLPAQVEDMLGQMPSDTKKLLDLVSDILVLEKRGGDDNDIQNKFAVAQSLASKCKGWGDRVQHIISTHVEDVSIDFVGNTPRGDLGADGDSNVLTRVLDANDKVQLALKGWREVEKQLSRKVASGTAQEKRYDSEQHSSPVKPSSRLKRHTSSRNSIPRSSSSIVDAIDQQLHAAQIMHIMGVDGSAEHLDSMSSDVTQTGPSFTTPTGSHSGMWVDFSDSSGSQLSRPTPGGQHSNYLSPFQSNLGQQPLLDTRGSGLSMKSGSPTKELGKREFRGSSSPETPHPCIRRVPSLNFQTPFASGETPAFVGTPRPNFMLASTLQVPLGPGPIATRLSGHNRELRQSNSFPRERSLHNDSRPLPSQSEEESSEFYSCASRTTELTASSSFVGSRHSQLATTRSLSSSSGEECDRGTAGSSASSIQPFRHHQYSYSTLPESEFHQEEQFDISRTDLTKTDFIRRVKSPGGGTNRGPNRRIPPALRVRFTPEHLKDVLERVGKVRPRSRAVHPEVSTARL